jgi:hypothetical protein
VEGGITQEQLLNNFRDDVWSNTCVMLLRFITSAEIKRRMDHFEPFVVVSCLLDWRLGTNWAVACMVALLQRDKWC